MQTLNRIQVALGERSYPVYHGTDIMGHLGHLLKEANIGRQIAIISVPPVSVHYLNTIVTGLDDQWETLHHDVPDGEMSKSLPVADELYAWLIQNRFERGSTILALGGGVVGDLAGFVAATYLRGVNLVHLPTSLLAQVDSSIGGKVGINHRMGKNLIGSFYQPRFVLTDIAALRTLPADEFICGLGEVVKYAIIRNEGLYEELNGNLADLQADNTERLERIVKICTEIKAGIVSRDEYESGERAVLNFGHTFGHALETYFNYQGFKHGQAVLLGMCCAIDLSLRLGMIRESLAGDLLGFIRQVTFDLPATFHDADPEKLVELMRIDKKVKDGKINVILVESLGKVKRETITDTTFLKESFQSILKEDRG